MKNKFLISIIGLFSLFTCIGQVEAASGKLVVTSNKSSVTAGASFVVTIKYDGASALGSLTMGTTMSNATCSVKSKATGATDNCSSGKCEVSYNNTSGYKKGTVLLELNCKSSSSDANIKAYSIGGDSYNIDGTEEITLSQGSVTVKVTTATTKKTTKKTTTKKTTTKGNSTSTTTRTTTIPISTSTTVLIPTSTTSTTERIGIPSSSNIKDIADDYKLKTLKIVGYDIDFNKNKTAYKITVPQQIEEIYVIAEAVDSDNRIENIGVINIKNVDSFIIRVHDASSSSEVSYKISIIRESAYGGIGTSITDLFRDINIYIIIVLLIVSLILLVLLILSKKKNKLAKYEPEEYAIPSAPSQVSNVYNHTNSYSSSIESNLEAAGITDLSKQDELTTVNIDNNKY